MKKIQAVIYDWGGVLIENPAPALVSFCSKALGVDQENFSHVWPLCLDDFQTGKISEYKFWQKMTKYLKSPMPIVNSLWYNAFVAAYVPVAEMFSIAAHLRKAGLKIALLSNTEKPAVEFFKSQNYDIFDAAVFSCLEGAKKPDKKIYEITLNRLKVPPDDALFVDDRQDFIDGAKKVGLNAILFQSVEKFKKDLRKFGLNVV